MPPPKQQQHQQRAKRMIAAIVLCLLLVVLVATSLTFPGGFQQDNNTLMFDRTTFQLSRWLRMHPISPLSQPQAQNSKHSMILVMGLPRSGSEAIHSFLECLSNENGAWRSAHYCCNTGGHATDTANVAAAETTSTTATKFPCPQGTVTCGSCVHRNLQSGQPAFANCGKNTNVYSSFDVETSQPFSWFLPQHFALPLLHEHYESATWILNTRDTPQRWATNVLHWYSVTNRIFRSFGIPYHDDMEHGNDITKALTKPVTKSYLYKQLDQSWRRAHNTTAHSRRHATLVDMYQRHATRVTDFVTNVVPQQQQPILISLNVDDPNAGHRLAEALGMQNPTQAATCWKFDAIRLDDDWKDFSLFPA